MYQSLLSSSNIPSAAWSQFVTIPWKTQIHLKNSYSFSITIIKWQFAWNYSFTSAVSVTHIMAF